MVFSIGVLKFMVAIFGYSALSEIPIKSYFKTKSRGSRAKSVKTETSELEKTKEKVQREIEGKKRQKLAEMEADINARKEAALKKVEDWTENEEARLQERLDKQYQAEAAKMKKD